MDTDKRNLRCCSCPKPPLPALFLGCGRQRASCLNRISRSLCLPPRRRWRPFCLLNPRAIRLPGAHRELPLFRTASFVAFSSAAAVEITGRRRHLGGSSWRARAPGRPDVTSVCGFSSERGAEGLRFPLSLRGGSANGFFERRS